MAANVERVVRTQIASGETTPLPEIVEQINDRTLNLIDVVKVLGEFLVSTDDAVRSLGVNYLSSLVTSIDRSRINVTAGTTLTNYFIAKVDDPSTLSPAIAALRVLSSSPSFDDDGARDVYQAVVDSVKLTGQPPSLRHEVLGLVKELVEGHAAAFKAMGSDFLSSFAAFVTGEKDPRNLMLLFNLETFIIGSFKIDDNVQDIFDVTYCYFPVRFRPPPNDPYGITCEDLQAALRRCMSATPLFAPLALPLFIEKAQTSSGPSMNDLLLTIAECIPSFGKEAVAERGTELWEIVKTEIYFTSDPEIDVSAQKALEALVHTLYPTLEDPPNGLGWEIVKQCLASLTESQRNGAAGAAKALAAVLRASPSVGQYAIGQAFSKLVVNSDQPELQAYRESSMVTIAALLTSASAVYAAPDSTRSLETERALLTYRSDTFEYLRAGLQSEELRVPAIRGSVAATQIPGFFQAHETEDIVKALDQLHIESNTEELRTRTLFGLTIIARTHPDIIQSLTIPILFDELPNHALGPGDASGRDKYRKILSTLTSLGELAALFEPLFIRVIAKVDALATSSISPEQREPTIAYVWDLLHTILKTINKKVAKKHADIPRYFSQLSPRLSQLVVAAALGDAQSIFSDKRLIALVALIEETLFSSLSPEKQTTVLQTVYQAFEEGKVSELVYQPGSLPPSHGSPLRPDGSEAERNLVALYSAIVQGLKSQTSLPFPSAIDFLSSKADWAITVAQDEFQLASMLDLITAFANKRSADMHSLPDLLEKIWSTGVRSSSSTLQSPLRALRVYFHIVKGLVLVRNEAAYPAIQRALDLMGDSTAERALKEATAHAFGVLSEHEKSKTGEQGSHLTQKILYAQRLWGFLLPKFVEGDEASTNESKELFLSAFAASLPVAPASVIVSSATSIFPLLIRSLSLPDSSERTNVLKALSALLESSKSSTEVNQLLHEHALTIIDAVLGCTVETQNSSSELRKTALTVMEGVADAIRFDTLQPVKSRVLRQLGLSLDDSNRDVRSAAVDTRARWYRYGP